MSGLAAAGLVLQNNGGDDISVAATGVFTFTTALSEGGTYAVTVKSQPVGQVCSASKNTGTIGSSDVLDVAVVCATQSYAVGGSVSGLQGAGLVLQDNAGDDLALTADGNFVFPGAVASGAAYAVTVKTQPSSPNQTCSVSRSHGTIAGVSISNVAVVCSTNSYYVRGVVTGLAGPGSVSLQNNGGDTINVYGGAPSAPFVFPTKVANSSPYAVTIATQPGSPSQTCSVTNATGTMGNADVGNVTVNCTPNSFTVGGTVSGLKGAGLVLQIAGGDDLAVAADGSFTFATPLASGGTYPVTVKTQPKAIDQVCTVTNDRAIVTSSNVTSVAVSCAVIRPKTIQIGMAASPPTGAGVFPYMFNGPGQPASSFSPYGLANTSVSSVVVDPSNKWVYSLDVNGIYQFNILNPVGVGLGIVNFTSTTAGGVSLTMDPLGRALYMVNYANSTVQMFTIDPANGNLTAGAGFALVGTASRAAAIDPAGRNLYVASEGSNLVNNFLINADGTLNWVNITIADATPSTLVTLPSGEYFYGGGRDSTLLTVYRRYAGGNVAAIVQYSADRPHQLAMHPAGKFLFAAEGASGSPVTLKTYRVVDSVSGALVGGPSLANVGQGGVAAMTVDPSGEYLYVLGTAQLETYAIATDGSLTLYGTPVSFNGGYATSLALSR